MLRHIAFLAALLLTALATAHANAQTFGPDPRVTVGTLDNGLNYLLMPVDASDPAAPVAGIRLIVDAGLIHEDHDHYGTADVLAEAARVRAGQGATATVAADHVVIALDLADIALLPARLSALAGIASAQPIPPDAIAAAKAAAAARLANVTADDRVRAQTLRRLAPESRAARRPAAGMGDAVRAISTERAQDFARRWYVPSNMTLILTAPGTPESLTRLVRDAFASLPSVPKPATPQAAATSWTPPSGPVIIQDTDLRRASVALIAARPGREPRSPRDFRSSMVEEVARRCLDSIVQIRVSKGKVPFDHADVDHARTPDTLAWTRLSAQADPARWSDAVAAIVTEANRIRHHGLSRADVNTALLAIVADLDSQAKAEQSATAPALADMLVTSRGGPSAQQRLDLLLSIIASITPGDVEWAFNRSFDPSSAVLVLAMPSSPTLPGESDVASVVRTAWFAQPDPASELVRPWRVLATLPAPGEIVELTKNTSTGVTSGWLSNGIRFHYRRMLGTVPNAVDISAVIAGGEILEDASTRGLSRVLARAWDFPSLPHISESELNALYQTTQTRMQVSAGADYIRLSVPTTTDHMNAYMQRLHAILAGAQPSEQAANLAIENIETAAQGIGRDINSTFMNLLAITSYKPTEVRLQPVPTQRARQITMDDVLAWRDRMALQPIEFAIVGDLSEEDALEAVRFYLGSLPARPRIAADTYKSLRTDVLNPLPHSAWRRVTGASGGQALFVHGFYIPTRGDDLDGRKFDVIAAILNARLVSEAALRGLPPNGQFANNFLGEYPGTSFFFYVCQATLEEAELPRLHTKIREILTAFASEGPTLDELTNAQNDVAARIEMTLDAPQTWWDHLSGLTYRGRDQEVFASTPLSVRALTIDDIRAAFNASFNRPDNRLELAVLPALPDQLMEFMNAPPPPPPAPVEQPQPAGPPTPPDDPANPPG